MTSASTYGTHRERSPNVSYADIERAALDILAAGRRPSVETARAALGRGSPATVAAYLKRFWRDLGVRAQGDPAALTRLPSEIVGAVEAIWQRALALAAQSAKQDDNAARERLERIRIDNEMRAQSFSMREKEFEVAARERENALSESRHQVTALMAELASNRATMSAQVARIMDLAVQVEENRHQVSTLIERAVTRNRKLTARPPRPLNHRKAKLKRKRQAAPRKTARRPPRKRRSKA
jgi:hypothetical protein